MPASLPGLSSPQCPQPSRRARRRFVDKSLRSCRPPGRPQSLAREFGCTAQTIANWVAQPALDRGKPLPGKEGLTTAERASTKPGAVQTAETSSSPTPRAPCSGKAQRPRCRARRT